MLIFQILYAIIVSIEMKEREIMEKLSERLSMVADFIPQGSHLLDVGSDHAYLPIYLAENKKITYAIAGEVVQGPYESAVRNVESNQLSHKIEVRLANGLAAFNEQDHIDVISICGMGGRLISEILEAGKDKLADVKWLVLQPNNREDDLRRWLNANCFILKDEVVMMENDKFYEIIVAEHGQEILSERDYRFGPHLSTEKSTVFKAKWERELEKLAYALSCIPENNQKDRSVISEKMIQIEEMISDESK